MDTVRAATPRHFTWGPGKTSTVDDITDAVSTYLRTEVWPHLEVVPGASNTAVAAERARVESYGHVFLSGKNYASTSPGCLTDVLLFSKEGDRPMDADGARWIRTIVSVLAEQEVDVAVPQSSGGHPRTLTCSAVQPSSSRVALVVKAEVHTALVYDPYSTREAAGNSTVPTAVEHDHSKLLQEFLQFVQCSEQKLLKEILQVVDSLMEEVADDPHVAPPQELLTGALPLTLCVPCYRVQVVAPDNSGTRLADVSPLTNQVLETGVYPSHCLTGCTTALLMALRTITGCSDPQYQRKGYEARAVAATRHVLQSMRAYITACAILPQGTEDSVPRTAHDDLTGALRSYDVAVNRTEESSPLHAPSALIHCRWGVSRSASVTFLFLLHTYRESLRAYYHHCVHRLEQQASALPQLNKDAEDCCREVQVTGYITLLEVMRRARPQVCPQPSFAVELMSIWRRDVCSHG